MVSREEMWSSHRKHGNRQKRVDGVIKRIQVVLTAALTAALAAALAAAHSSDESESVGLSGFATASSLKFAFLLATFHKSSPACTAFVAPAPSLLIIPIAPPPPPPTNLSLSKMVHADAAALPSYVQTKADFYDHLESSLSSLIEPGTDWISSLSNASSLIYHSMNRYPEWTTKRINWAGFYLLSPLLPSELAHRHTRTQPTLLLGPFHGLPACQLIPSLPGKGVCADASSLLPPRPVRVADTDAYPGHIACDSLSRSEIVIPLVIARSRLPEIHQQPLNQQSPKGIAEFTPQGDDRSWAGRGGDENVIVGVLDIDCESLDGFDAEDEQRLNKIVQLILERSAW